MKSCSRRREEGEEWGRRAASGQKVTFWQVERRCAMEVAAPAPSPSFFAGARRKPRFFILIIIMFIFLSFETNRKRIIIMRTTLSSERPSCDKAPHRAPHLRCCCGALEQGTTIIHLRAPVTRSVMGTSISRISAGLGPACWRCGQPAVLGCGGVTAGCLGGQNIPSLKVLREGT